jgi:hypothetical protein
MSIYYVELFETGAVLVLPIPDIVRECSRCRSHVTMPDVLDSNAECECGQEVWADGRNRRVGPADERVIRIPRGLGRTL